MSNKQFLAVLALVLTIGQQAPVFAAACGQTAAQWGKPGCPYPSFGRAMPVQLTCHRIRRMGHLVRVCDKDIVPLVK
ncbi:exported protein of unknown function [Beijerinckiaceae bacterium RH AL1]|nr:hypothetical protein [Beijerinckiaceae bacterium]VVB48513.1 exported protein of unknown function [Beijerinckiaceae bacterium RH CH11]VVB48594.1 exported protein of unknown function [Beijerinckiaceae bacterium RH AL8]VVC56432.1 exported protein of unknown function [Beijerinckiaceae bacterium RH AL1]